MEHQVLFVIASPDVYKSPNSDCYIVFGEAKVCMYHHCGHGVGVLIRFLCRLRILTRKPNYLQRSNSPKGVLGLGLSITLVREAALATMTMICLSLRLRKRKARSMRPASMKRISNSLCSRCVE